MRTSSEMLELILNIAKNDERIRAVQMQGSRTNSKVPIDKFQDFDICYYVNNISSFKNDKNWINIFGERLMLQIPDLGIEVENMGIIVYTMLFTDGNRIDLVLIPTEIYKNGNDKNEESEAVLLFAKDEMFKPFPPATHKQYLIKPPTEKEYFSVCNKFWWSAQYVAKGIYRDELPYVKTFLDKFMRDELNKIIEWYIGNITNYSVSTGKYGRYFKLYLNEEQYDMFCKTYTDNNYKNIWDSMFLMCDLFSNLSLEVAKCNNFNYNREDEENMIKYLKKIYNNTKGIYHEQ